MAEQQIITVKRTIKIVVESDSDRQHAIWVNGYGPLVLIGYTKDEATERVKGAIDDVEIGKLVSNLICAKPMPV